MVSDNHSRSTRRGERPLKVRVGRERRCSYSA